MCLAIPGKVMEIENLADSNVRMAKVNFGGIMKDVSLEMLPDAEIGNYVLVHVGFAISIVDEVEAKKVFEYLREIGELDDLEPGKEFEESPQKNSSSEETS